MADAASGAAAVLSRGTEDLARRWGLTHAMSERLRVLASLLIADATAPTAIRTPNAVLDDHLADSLVALEIDSVRSAGAIADIGSGAGLPGLPLAIALPNTRFSLIEAGGRKCAFIERAVAACGLANVEILNARAEELGRPECFDAVIVRALAPLAVVNEYAAPLLRIGGALIAWRGRREVETEEMAARAAETIGMRLAAIHRVEPYEGATERHLHLFLKVGETPARFPRRPGMARKRPLAAR